MGVLRPFPSLAKYTIFGLILMANGTFAQNIQYQPRPPFQNQPANPCANGPIRQGAWTPLGNASQGGERVDVYVNDTMIQAMNYDSRAAGRPILYLKVEIQLRGASGAPVRERIMLDGRGQFVRQMPTEGELRQNVDNYLEPIPPGSAYAMVERHLLNKRCF